MTNFQGESTDSFVEITEDTRNGIVSSTYSFFVSRRRLISNLHHSSSHITSNQYGIHTATDKLRECLHGKSIAPCMVTMMSQPTDTAPDYASTSDFCSRWSPQSASPTFYIPYSSISPAHKLIAQCRRLILFRFPHCISCNYLNRPRPPQEPELWFSLGAVEGVARHRTA